MKTQLFIPDKIKVGYQERSDTYTKRLGYVIYYDEKGVLRKEKSWKGWCNSSLGENDYQNVPTEGFVLNKDVGGVRHSWSSWNQRMEKVRVFDPRGFEFEINIPNMLYILQECTSTKGKGLEGEFVYGWDGTELILLPVTSKEYQDCLRFTAIQGGKVTTKDLVPGCIYRNKREQDFVYLGRENWTALVREKNNAPYGHPDYFKSATVTTKRFIFSPLNREKTSRYELPTSLSNFVMRVTDTPVDNYAELAEELSNSIHISEPVGFELEKKQVVIQESFYYYMDARYYLPKDNGYVQYAMYANNYDKSKIAPVAEYLITLENNQVVSRNERGNREPRYTTPEKLVEMEFFELYVVLKNGKKYPFSNYRQI